ncbi:hypothetical protein [Mycobacterium sp. shizuoka-1]|uniref:hypothetical protein n=1 Tax=Mycobacterium sp. shizuoka-1 TaxID=2039281 RepID=UPI0011580390|nr:hypothetical protein [Mycobacterium sp. shizuoka-1]
MTTTTARRGHNRVAERHRALQIQLIRQEIADPALPEISEHRYDETSIGPIGGRRARYDTRIVGGLA